MPASSNLGKSTGWQTDCHNILHKDRIDKIPVEKAVCWFFRQAKASAKRARSATGNGGRKKAKKITPVLNANMYVRCRMT